MEKLSVLKGFFFNEAEYCNEDATESALEDVLPRKERNKKQKGKRNADL